MFSCVVKAVGVVRSAMAVVFADAKKAAFWAAMFVFGVMVAPATVFATDPVPLELPDTGVDMGASFDAMIAGLGPVVQKIVLAFGAYLLIRFGMKWFRRTT